MPRPFWPIRARIGRRPSPTPLPGRSTPYGVQIIGACALLQLLFGNIGRPGAASWRSAAMPRSRARRTSRRSTTRSRATWRRPTALKKHDTLQDYLDGETMPTGYWANMPKFMVSYLKSMYGDAATKENQFGYDWHPKILGDHSHMAMFVAMNAGKVKGMFCIGQNPATSLNAKLERAGLRKLDWLVVKDNWLTETATFWKNAPGGQERRGEAADIKTEVFFSSRPPRSPRSRHLHQHAAPAALHHKAAEAPGDCRSDTWFTTISASA